MAETQKKKINTNKHKAWPRMAKSNGKKTCTAKDCKRAYRAKGYCFFHYKKWRQGDLPHSRYRTCSKPECRKKVSAHGLCEQHLAEGNSKAPEAAAAPAAPAAAEKTAAA